MSIVCLSLVYCILNIKQECLIMNKIESQRPRIAVSACLLGKPVRYDGGHKRDRFISDTLSRVADLEPVCPELLAGLGTPRPTIQLRSIDGQVRLVQSKDVTVDLTSRMQSVAEEQARRLKGRIAGFIGQRKSPSCGMERVPIARGEGLPADRTGTGLFVQHFRRLCPLVPVEEEGRLNDPVLRENFLERVFALDRWNRLPADRVEGFIEFHAHHKLNLMLRGSDTYRRLGRIVSGVTRETLAERRSLYIATFMQALEKKAQRGHHVNVLQHMMGYLKRQLDSAEKAELLEVFRAYREAETPLIAPLVLMRHHLSRHPIPYLERQHYLQPYPSSLGLRAHV